MMESNGISQAYEKPTLEVWQNAEDVITQSQSGYHDLEDLTKPVV